MHGSDPAVSDQTFLETMGVLTNYESNSGNEVTRPAVTGLALPIGPVAALRGSAFFQAEKNNNL